MIRWRAPRGAPRGAPQGAGSGSGSASSGGRRRPWSLRTRLLAALLALLAAVCLVVGLVSVIALRHYLLSQLDGQVAAAGSRSAMAEDHPNGGGRGDGDRHGPDFLLAPGQASGTLGAHVTGGRLESAAVLDSAGTPRDVPGADDAALVAVPVDGHPHTRTLAGLGSYRLLATRSPDGDTIITGLPLRDIDTTVGRLSAVVSLVAVAGLAAAGLAGGVIIRLALQPLRRVAASATRVSELPLDRGEVVLGVRVPDADTDARTEVGLVGTAFNRMLGHVATALTARRASELNARQFLADASHELRTPLSAIRGYAEFARRSCAELPDSVRQPDIARAASRIEAEAIRMTGLVDDLLLLARLDAGRAMQRGPVDLSALLVDAVSDAHAAGPDRPIRLRMPDEPLVVTGDAARLHQVVANLLSNAATHTPPGTTVTVSLSLPSDAGEAVVTVADDGPGIPPVVLPDVFERFARADTSRSRATGSTGLGLAIAAAVVQAHGGDIQVTSRPACTVFTVRLPVAGRPASGNGARLADPVTPAEPAGQPDR